MFKYKKEKEIQTLNAELEKFRNIGNEKTVEEQLANLSIDKKGAIKRIESMIDDLIQDKIKMEKAYNRKIQDAKTAAARIKHKHLIKEYHQCVQRIFEIGEDNKLVGTFNLNDYTSYRDIKGVIKKHLHMTGVGVERINRQTTK